MKDSLTAKQSIAINAPADKVWSALTDPEQIKKYMFGTEATSDWKVGSSITFKGEWEGTSYEDKGIILEVEPKKVLRYTYWTSFSGTDDKPENYDEVSYELAEKDGRTEVTVNQGGVGGEEGKKRSEENWKSTLENIKKMLEEEQ